MKESVCHNGELFICLEFNGHHLNHVAGTAVMAADRSEGGGLKAGRGGK